MKLKYPDKIARELDLAPRQVSSTLKLLTEGATIPFIARYRKEITDSLDETSITKIRDRYHQLLDLDKRKETVLASIESQGKLTGDLKNEIEKAATLSELEDIYLPYRPKKKTKAAVARARGLEPLAKILMRQESIDIKTKASEFVNKKEKINNVEDALAGARDIIAELINENKYARGKIRYLFKKKSRIYSTVVKGKKDEAVKYNDYFEWDEPALKVPSHRALAMLRGEREGFLRIKIAPEESDAIDILKNVFVKNDNDAAEQVAIAIKDSYRRLLAPSMEKELRKIIKDAADEKAINIFKENLRQLLLAPPLGQKNVLAIDPGFKTGCKIVCLDRQGNLLHNETIFPHPPQREMKTSIRKILSLVDAYDIEAIAIGNGTAGRETENMIKRIRFDSDIIAVMVNENGASVYSASGIAREEFPQYDVTVRGAVSIGRRLMDPLAELVKIDPKSIGVGQYQHDVNQNALQKSLKETVESCVNQVGVEVNTASPQLLTYVSGLGPSLAKKVVKHRTSSGPFNSRDELKKITGFGNKAFEQAAGFLRIHNAENPLDQTAFHPESYEVIYKMADSVGTTVEGLIKNDEIREKIDLHNFLTDKTGMPTLTDIMEELAKPGRDPREEFDAFEFDENVNSIDDIEKGMILTGIVTNITAFGAFVDIGVHQDGLVHVSQIAEEFVKDPNDYMKINQKIKVAVLDVDVERKRIQLSMKGIN